MLIFIAIAILVGVVFSRIAIRYDKSGFPWAIVGTVMYTVGFFMSRYLISTAYMKEDGTIEEGAILFAGLMGHIVSALVTTFVYFRLRNFWQANLPLGKNQKK